MKEMIISGIKIASDFDCSKAELKKYVGYVKELVPNVTSIAVRDCADGCVDLKYTAKAIPFERIRRITGYLVGTTDRWNDSKQAEERDRVKHEVSI